MKRFCKTICLTAILLFGIFIQEKIKAQENDGNYYSRSYSVLSANVGNSRIKEGFNVLLEKLLRLYPDTKLEQLLKLLPDSDEEKKVTEEIRLLKPEILILIEAFSETQVEYMTFDSENRRAAYSIHGGPYDFICVRNDIGDVVKHEQMNEGQGDSVGYVDVALKDENGRKVVRLFYAHFPSPFPKLPVVWGIKEHEAHKNAFNWIQDNLSSNTPCLIAGDFNNDFIRWKSDLEKESKKLLPDVREKFIEEQKKNNSSFYIEERVSALDFLIFNPKEKTGTEYETTHRVPGEPIWKWTLDWVMGRDVTAKDQSFVTSPPDWWKDESRFTFDHKPLYGNVVFSWEKENTSETPPSNILGTYFLKDDELEGSIELKADKTSVLVDSAKWLIEVRRWTTLDFTKGYGFEYRYRLVLLKPPLQEIDDDGQGYGYESDPALTIMAEPLRERLNPGKKFFTLQGMLYYEIEGDRLVDSNDEIVLALKEQDAVKVQSSESIIWNRYSFVVPGLKGGFLEFKEDGTVLYALLSQWEVEGNTIKFELLLGSEVIEAIEGKIENGVITIAPSGMEKDLVFVKQE